MRILFVGFLPNTRLHAVPRVMLHHGEEMERLGHQVDYVFAPDVALPAVPGALQPLAFSLAVAPRLLRAAGQGRCDVVAAHSGSGWVFGMLRGLLRSSNAKYVLLSHGWEDLLWGRYMQAVREGVATVNRRHRLRYAVVHLGQTRLALRFADHMICSTRDERDHVLARYRLPASRVSVVPLGVSEGYFLDRPEEGSAGDRLLFVGQWGWRKGFHVLSAALDRLLEIRPAVRVSLVGTRAPAAEVMAAFSEKVRFALRVLPEVDEASLQREYQSHDILLLPSLYEGFGLCVLEAMAASMAVITTDAGGMKEWMASEVDGILIPSGDAEALLKAILRLLDDGELRSRLGGAARQTARRYTWERSAAGMLSVFQRLVEAEG